MTNVDNKNNCRFYPPSELRNAIEKLFTEGAEDGSATFNIPDLTGEFLRGGVIRRIEVLEEKFK